MMQSEMVDSNNFEQLERAEIEKFGFWIYLMSDLVIFSIFFATFAVHYSNFAGGPGPKALFDVPYLYIETMLLLTSSMTYGLGVIAMHQKRAALVIVALLVTFLLGAGFVGMEINEFRGMLAAGHGPDKSSFLSSFFALVGTHGIHVFFGLLWMVLMVYQVVTKGLTIPVQSRLTRLSLFWHFLDIVWVGVFTVVYLSGLV